MISQVKERFSARSANNNGALSAVEVDKMSISLDPDLGDEVRSAARRSGKPLSAWIAEAAAAKLRSEALARFLDDWEEEHGALTPAEIRKAEVELGLRPRKVG